jgi:chaperonin GroES
VSEFKQQLLNDLIVVQLIEQPPTRIKLPDWQRTLRGTVIAVGPGKMLYNGQRAPMMTQVGDTISFGAAVGMDTSYGGHVNIRMMKDGDVDFVLGEAA